MLALARKYRPRTFASVAVQSHVSNTLKGAIARDRVAPGYLLCGPRGTGKTTLARVLAMALNCERRVPGGARAAGAVPADEGEPCGECESCRRIWAGSASLDVVEIDAASNRGVDDARELRERAMYAPSGDHGYKVYIVDEAHMLTREAWNALLKILEEPPPRVVFVFATTEPQKIAQSAAPVLSRLQRFDLRRIGPGEIRERLAQVLAQEGVTVEREALGMIARAADGGLRDALSLTDQVLSLGAGAVTVDRVREALGLVAEDEYLAILDLIAEHRAGDVFPVIARLADLGIDFGAFLAGLADLLRATLALALGGEAPDLSERARAALEERRDRLSTGDLLRMLTALTELEPRFRKSGQQRLLVETLLVRFALLDKSVALEEVLRTLGGAPPGGGGAGGEVAKVPAARPARPATPTTPRHTSRVDAAPPRAAGAPDLADAPPAVAVAAPAAGLDINRLSERWDEVVAEVRRVGRAVLATMLEQSVPVAASAAGVVTLQAGDEAAKHAIETAHDDVLAALRTRFPDARRVAVRLGEGVAPAAARRATRESVATDRMTALRQKDPVLSAAIDELDLELLD